MASIPPFMTGKQLTYLRITPQTVDEAGLLADGTAVALVTSTGALGSAVIDFGVVDDVEFFSEVTTDNISPTHDGQAHMVDLRVGYGFTVTEILRTGAATNSLLATAWHSAAANDSDIAKIEFYRARRRWTLYAVMTEYNESFTGGKSVARMSFRPVDAGVNTITTATGVEHA